MPRISPAPALAALRAHLPLAREGVDPEGVHQLRVASRRLTAYLHLADRRALRDDLRWLRARSSDARDVDVLLTDGAPLAEPLRAAVERARPAARLELVQALDSERLAGLLAALQVLPPVPRTQARGAIDQLAERVEKRGKRALRERDPHRQDEKLHSLRRALRRLRYGLEWLGEKPRGLKRAQGALGDLGDLALRERWLARVPDRAAVADERAALAAARDAARGRAVAAWRAHRSAR